MKKIDKNYIIIFIVSIIAIVSIWPFNHLFGSTTDWISQHIVFPDYFRNLFYSTHELFPSFAFNIGAGQNIYNFSYYGLYNPIILISYLLPFASMKDYLTVSNIILYILFGLLMYKWLSYHYERNRSLLLSIIAILSSSVLFHFHRHFMFVSYLPFLIYSLICVDKYIENKKSIGLIIGIFLLIMVSYYYSIPSILTIILYFIYRYISHNKEISYKTMFNEIVKLMIPILISILMASVLILPTFLSLLEGRDTSLSSLNILKLLIPKINIDAFVYDNYSIGLTAISVVSLLILFNSKKKENKFLSIALFILVTIPLFICILNGMLYVRDKVLIAFLPLLIVIIGEALNELYNKEVKLKNIVIVLIYSCILFLIFKYFNIYYYIEVTIITILIIVLYKNNSKLPLIIYILLVSIINFYISNINDKYVSNVSYNELNDSRKYSIISDTLEDSVNYRFSNLVDSYYSINKVYSMNHLSTSVYSSSQNINYKKFYIDVFKNNLANRNDLMLSSSRNILFNTYMGVKYIYSNYGLAGYEKMGDNIYKNDNVLPIFYVRSNTLNLDVFNKIPYPYNIEVLLNNVITNNSNNTSYDSNIEKYDLKYTYDSNSNIDVDYKNSKYYINVKEDTNIKLNLEEVLDNKILFINFKVNNQHDCRLNDSTITINNITNKLTCKREFYENNNYVFHYVISSDKEISSLDVNIKKGLYIIDNMETYILDYSYIIDINKNIDEAKVNSINGDFIDISCYAKEDGYFVTTLPYDNNFKIYVDDKLVSYEKINTSFVGFKILKGSHNVKIIYSARGLLLGKILSICGIVLFGIYIYICKNLLK